MSSPAVVKAKRFLVNRIVDQAKREEVPLTEVEISMLGFAEASATPRELESAEVFARDYDNEQFETKIGKLVRAVHKLDKERGQEALWDQSLEALADEDLYLSVLLRKADIHQPWRYSLLTEWRRLRGYILPIVLVAIGFIVAFTPLGTKLVPSIFLRLVLLLCFWLAPLMINKLTDKQVD
jgi:hypothetical protein